MSYEIEITEQALAEVKEACLWLGQVSREKAALWHFDLLQKIDSLADWPLRCPLAPESDSFNEEIRHLIFGKYRIIFRVEDETVYILHVRHGRMKPVEPESFS